MSSQPGPWSNQPVQPTGPAPGPGWVQPGAMPPAPPPVYGPVPTHYSGPAGGYPAPPSLGPPPPAYPAAPGYGAPPGVAYGPPLRNDYANWGTRVKAYLIDTIPSMIGSIVFLVGYFVWLFQFSAGASTGSLDLASGLLPMIVGFAVMLVGLGWTIYNRWLVGGRTGQSLGKRVTKIKLVGELTDAPIGPTNAFVRDMVHILDGMAFVGFLWPLWDDKRQTFADQIVRTVVVNGN